ncbi:hypothetical protein Tco_1274504 [Tanacetum coccineum]
MSHKRAIAWKLSDIKGIDPEFCTYKILMEKTSEQRFRSKGKADKKGAENLAADHLSRLENPHQDKLENKEIMETFPLETLGSVALRVDSTPWFADFANTCGEFHSSKEISNDPAMCARQRTLDILEACQRWTHQRTHHGVNHTNLTAKSSRSVPADYVPAGHVIISADRYREYADLSYRRN